MGIDTTTALDERPKYVRPTDAAQMATMPAALTVVVLCPECGHSMVRAPNYWTCQQPGHTKLIHDDIIRPRLAAAIDRGDLKRPSGRPYTAGSVLQLFKRASRKGLIPSLPIGRPDRRRRRA